MTTKNILVIGATGKVGSAVIRQLAHHDSVKIHAGVRDISRASSIIQEEVTFVPLDLDDPDTIVSAVKNIDSLLLLTGYSVDMLKQSKRVIDAAKASGVSHIVHIGASGNPTSEVAHWGWHRMIEAYIEQQGFDYTHVQPEAFMQNINTFGWLQEHSLSNLIKDSVWSWVDADDVGALAGEALARPEDFRNQVWRLGYDAADMRQVADMLSAKIGRTIEIEHIDPNDFYQAAIDAGADPAYIACIRDQFILNGKNAIANVDATFDASAFEHAVGRKPSSFQDYINRDF